MLHLQPSTLYVGRASAGSGKTFSLTREYIRLLVDNPDNYRHILAVTFTNKATAELKSRIVDTLHAIAHDHPEAQPYVSQLTDSRHTPEVVRQHAATALTAILHDYSRFRIETIDSFFQSIIRDLARELNLTANLRVDIDQDEALAEAVSHMIETMRQGDSTFNAIVGYVGEKMDANTNWKIDKELTDFSHNIFNEHYLKVEREMRRHISDPAFYGQYRQRLKARIRTAAEERTDLAQRFEKHCYTYGLQPDMFVGGGRGVYAYFPKLAAGKPAKDLPKALRDDPFAPWLKDEKLNAEHAPLFQNLIKQETDLRSQIATAEAILRYSNQMQLLGRVDETLRSLNEEHNRFILADTAHRLNEIISDNDVPFIMEKAATQFRYIMIDEFQDTSELQWLNFMPLIRNSISAGQRCIVVGDVKQSIYRWRNSDWGILNNISRQPELKGMVDDQTLTRTLDTNRRSDEHVVSFNNNLFRQAATDMTTHFDHECGNPPGTTTDIQTAYAGLEQEILSSKRGQGYVRITEITKSQPNDEATSDPTSEPVSTPSTDAQMLRQVEQTIVELTTQHGLTYSDITILTRHNRELKAITRHLKQAIPDIQIISSEAFQLDSSVGISIIIQALRTLSGSQSKMAAFNLGTLAFKYQTEVLCQNNQSIDRYFNSDPETVRSLLPQAFTTSMEELQSLPLHELCERIYDLFSLHRIEGESAFMFTFFDAVSAFIHDRMADIDTFLNHWDDTLHEQTIPAEGAQGIQMLTIHKSKGLEFHTVIVPYCNWNMDGRPSVLWCPTDTVGPGSMATLPVTPVNFNKGLKETEFRHDYEQEKLKNYVDNLNLMYVAFTRAAHNLFIITSDDKSGYTAYNVLHDAVGTIYGHNVNTDSGTYIDLSLGTIHPHLEGHSQQPHSVGVTFQTGGIKAQFRQSNASKEFTFDPDSPAAERQSYIKRGLVVHKVFEQIRTIDDIPQVLSSLEQQGIMGTTDFKADIQADIQAAMNNAEVSRWFAPEWTVMNECSIIMHDAQGNITTQRPDRVIYNSDETIVIDYKTGRPNSEHHKQVERYVGLLRSMGMPNVKGYLWYMNEGKVVSTSPNNEGKAVSTSPNTHITST